MVVNMVELKNNACQKFQTSIEQSDVFNCHVLLSEIIIITFLWIGGLISETRLMQLTFIFLEPDLGQSLPPTFWKLFRTPP